MQTRDIVRLRFLSRHLPVPILGGPNRGNLWSLATRSTFIRGAFESSRCQVIARLAEGASSFWDLGAHYGYVTLIAARRASPSGRIVAIEPNISNLWYLRKHVAWNRLRNVAVLPCAIGHEEGIAEFAPVTSGTGLIVRCGERGGYQVQVATVDGIVASGQGTPPDVMKVDIDHTHVDFLTGARKTLTESPAVLLVATNNSHPVHRRMKSSLTDLGYRVVEPDRCRDSDSFHGIESELLAIGPGVQVDDDIVREFCAS